jgi:hypothetical protein
MLGPAVATATGLMITVAVAVTAAQPLLAASVFVTVYVPGVDVEGVMAPVVAFSVRPVVEENVPAVAPVLRLAATVPVAEVQ